MNVDYVFTLNFRKILLFGIDNCNRKSASLHSHKISSVIDQMQNPALFGCAQLNSFADRIWVCLEIPSSGSGEAMSRSWFDFFYSLFLLPLVCTEI